MYTNQYVRSRRHAYTFCSKIAPMRSSGCSRIKCLGQGVGAWGGGSTFFNPTTHRKTNCETPQFFRLFERGKNFTVHISIYPRDNIPPPPPIFQCLRYRKNITVPLHVVLYPPPYFLCICNANQGGKNLIGTYTVRCLPPLKH